MSSLSEPLWSSWDLDPQWVKVNSPQAPLRRPSGAAAPRRPLEAGPGSDWGAGARTEPGPSAGRQEDVDEKLISISHSADWAADPPTFSRSSSRVCIWSTTLKTTRVSSAPSGRHRSGLHRWISATVVPMDWILFPKTWRHSRDRTGVTAGLVPTGVTGFKVTWRYYTSSEEVRQ